MPDTQMDNQTTGRLEMRWTPTTDERGRTYLESHWVCVDEQPAALPTIAASAA